MIPAGLSVDVPAMKPAWTGRLLSWQATHPVTLQSREMGFDPTLRAKGLGLNLWIYRRIVDGSIYTEGFCRGDVTLVNWPQNDYLDGNLIGVSAEEARKHVDAAKQLSLSLFYWLQTEAPRPDGGFVPEHLSDEAFRPLSASACPLLKT